MHAHRGRWAAEPPDPTELEDLPPEEREEAERQLEPVFDDCDEPVRPHEIERAAAGGQTPRTAGTVNPGL